jgi:GDP-L-fucose synthase
MPKNKLVLIAGGTGMVGASLIRKFRCNGYSKIHATYHNRRPNEQDPRLFTPHKLNTADISDVEWHQCDHTNQTETSKLLKTLRPYGLIIAAAKVGGIFANVTHPAEFIFQNLAIGTNLIHSAHISGVEKLVFLGSACIYPENSIQPIPESALLAGPLEPSNEAYAVAKIAGIKLCDAYYKQYNRNYYSLMPNNLYGPGDNFDLTTSHVLPALIRKFHEAQFFNEGSVTIWGTGEPRREFLHVDDLASAANFCYESVEASDLHNTQIGHINVGTSRDISIQDLAIMIQEIVGFEGKIDHDLGKPDGMKRKLLDSKRILSLGWQPSIPLEAGLRDVCNQYREAAHSIPSTIKSSGNF